MLVRIRVQRFGQAYRTGFAAETRRRSAQCVVIGMGLLRQRMFEVLAGVVRSVRGALAPVI